MANRVILSLIPSLRREFCELLKSIKKSTDWKTLEADHKNSLDYDPDSAAYLDVTIGCTFDFSEPAISWNYQTGDNSYTGGAYGHPEWFTASLTKRSNCKEIADDLINEIHGRIAELCSCAQTQNV